MMKVMLTAIEIFSLVFQRIFAQKVLTQRRHSGVCECCVWGMYFVISNFFTYNFANSASLLWICGRGMLAKGSSFT